ncbi:hypothetical protein YTPLAS18_02280 [Nitrospira sp.]|nr:hypothetical protein YTPLAS18_02280 [Nitrospira sp.]
MLFTLAVGVAAINTGNNLFYLLVAMMLSLIMMSGLLSELCLRRIEVGCHAPDFVYAETEVALTLVVTNHKRWFPCFSLRLVEVVAGRAGNRPMHVKHLPPGGSVLISLSIRAHSRGRLDVQGIQVATPFPFGLFLKRSFHSKPISLLVLPNPQPIPAQALARIAAAGVSRAVGRRGTGADLYNLRLYQPGDDSRLIHWMSTARTSQLILRETEAEHHPRVTIRLSTIAPPEADEALERAVSVAASLVAHFHSHGFQTRVCAGARIESSSHGPDGLARLLTPLALCQRSWPDTSGMQADGDISASEWNEQTSPEVVVLPWTSPAIASRYAHAVILFDTSDDLTIGVPDETGPRVPA